MEPATADRLVLISGPGPEHLALILVLAIAAAGAAVGVLMARRGRAEAWSLVGFFGLVLLSVALALAHLPTRLALDRKGVDIAFWSLRDERPWSEIATANIRHARFGIWVSFAPRESGTSAPLLWPRWPGLLVPDAELEPRQIAMRIDAWRLTAGR